MRLSHVATALAAFTAGLTAAAALHRRTDGSRPAITPSTAGAGPSVAPAPDRDGVVLPFVRPAVPAAASEPSAAASSPAAPARCGDSGGRTRAGAPCAARAAAGGRCHHHPLAA